MIVSQLHGAGSGAEVWTSSQSDSSALSLDTNPASGTMPAIERPANVAGTATGSSRRPTPDSSRRSRVPVHLSTTPTVRKSVDLKRACAMTRASAESADGDDEAELAHGAVGEEQLDVVLAQGTPPADEHREEAEAHGQGVPGG